MEEAFQNMSVNGEDMEMLPETSAQAKDSTSGMNNKEMEQHLQLCMKLSAENKINSKNAFGLHLIGLLKRLVKNKNTDLQFASLSLQASSKIYSGRVDALYKETFQFHNHLQTILAGGKKSSPNDNQDIEGGFEEGEGPSEKPKASQKKKFKSYVGTEESVTFTQQSDKLSEPHQNFELIKSAFSGIATADKLLNCLQFEGDSCEIFCAKSSKIHKPKTNVNVANYTLSKAEKNLLQNTVALAEEWDVSRLEDGEVSRNLFHSPNQSLPVGMDGSFMEAGDIAPPDFGGTSPGGLNADSLIIGNDISPMPEDNESSGLQVLNDRFGALDITAGAFVNDISQAVSKDGSINPALLPPQSALRRVMKTAEKASARKEAGTEKKKKEVKPREPFFRGQAIDHSLFMPGKRTVLADTAIACWDRADTTVLGTGFDEFEAEFNPETQEEIINEEFEDLPYTIMAATDPSFGLKNRFLKRKPVWKLFRETTITAPKESSPGIFRKVASMATAQPEQLADSFRNMSINDSFQCNDPIDDIPNDDIPAEVSFGGEEQVMLSDFADDIQVTLVPPPELVKPINVRLQEKAMDFDTQKIKQNLWSIISAQLETKQSVLFSEVCDELNREIKIKESDGISWQFPFMMVLVLANEKVLLLENVEEGNDLVISKDISEVDMGL